MTMQLVHNFDDILSVGQSGGPTTRSDTCCPDIGRCSCQSTGGGHNVGHADDPRQRGDKLRHDWSPYSTHKRRRSHHTVWGRPREFTRFVDKIVFKSYFCDTCTSLYNIIMVLDLLWSYCIIFLWYSWRFSFLNAFEMYPLWLSYLDTFFFR